MNATVTADVVASRISDVLRTKYGLTRYAVTWIARALGSDQRAVWNWWCGTNAPRAADLINLMAEVEEIDIAVNQLVAERRAQRAGGIACSQLPWKSDGSASDGPTTCSPKSVSASSALHGAEDP